MIYAVNKKQLVLAAIFFLCLVLCGTLFFVPQPLGAWAAARKVPVYCVDTEEKVLSVTFDAAWGADKTEKILDLLDQFGVKATFFLVGFWTDNFPQKVEEIHRRGHEIGTHSETHPHLSGLSREKIRSELQSSSEKITKLTNQKIEVFRAPFGDYNDKVVETAQDLGLFTIQWDVDSLDWKGLSAQQICDRVTKRAKNGSIVLFHNNSDAIVEALPLVLMALQMKGFAFRPVGQLIYKTDCYTDNNGVQHTTKT